MLAPYDLYCTLTDDCELAYKVDGLYAPETEGGVIWNDPDLAIPWPVEQPLLSAKDEALPRLKDAPTLPLYSEASEPHARSN